MGWRLSTFHGRYNLLELLQVRHSLQIFAISFFNHHILHTLHILHMTGTINQTKHPQWIITQQVTCSLYSSGSWSGRHTHTHKDHSPAANKPAPAPVPCSACLLSSWGGRGFILNTCSHCGGQVKWTPRISSYSEVIAFLCVVHKKKNYLFIAPDGHLSICPMSTWQAHLMFIEYYYWIFEWKIKWCHIKYG